MKSLPIALDRLLSNPSFERLEGKLVKVFDDQSRIILELKSKKLRTLFGPFPEADLMSMQDKAVVVFIKEGESSRVYDARMLPKERRASATGNSTGTRSEGAPRRASSKSASEPKTHTPKVKWKKYAEAKMVGEPVKLASMARGFEMEPELIERILAHLEIVYGPNTRAIAYLDFRKVFHFLCSPEFARFMAGER